jgi:hypothetical protein
VEGASAFGRRAYSSGVKSSVSIRTSPPSLNLPYRKKQLRRLVGKRRIGIVLSEHTDEDGALIFRQAYKLGLEGIVSKRLSAPYRSGPSRVWIKVKNPDSPAVAALAGAGADQRPLKLGEPAQDGKYELAVRRRSVGPCVLERAEAGAAAAIRNSTERLPFDR